jgi:hypothetical protein
MSKSSLDRERRGHSPNMTSRRSVYLTSLPILVLAPLLAAPRGCHFGSDDVPLGANADEEVGGAGSGDDGGGASPPIGGSGGTSGGSSGSSSGSGSSSLGGSGGSPPSDSVCVETRTPLSELEENPLGISRLQVEALLAGAFRALLTPERANPTMVTVEPTMVTVELVGPLELFYVESENHPDLEPGVGTSCENHVRAETALRFFSDDGSFDETFPNHWFMVMWDSRTDPTADIVAASGAKLSRDELRGTYNQERIRRMEDECLQTVQLNLDITETGFDGMLTEEFIRNPLPGCVEGARSVMYMSGFATWDCQGAACRVTPNDSIVVEADSCDRFGVQITKSGDEASFSRDGGVLARDEIWDCGCPVRPEFVMAYTPTSPMELRLCDDSSADNCEAICERPVSYDLTRAFEWAGTTAFRFVD